MKIFFHIHFLVISTVLITVQSCPKKKPAETAPPSAQQTPPPPPVNTAATPSVTPLPANTDAPKDGSIRYVVSFYSIGQGIDGKVNDEFVKFLDTYPNPVKIKYEPKHWGREGETDYCLALNELSAPQQAEFVKKANELLAKSKLVHIKENAQCEHVNWPASVNAPADDTYRLAVEFYSTGQGSDYKVKEEFVKFLDSYSKKIAYEPTTWGREGETDYCLKLSELSASEQAEFVKKAKELLAKSSLVHINENAKCVHKH